MSEADKMFKELGYEKYAVKQIRSAKIHEVLQSSSSPPDSADPLEFPPTFCKNP